MLERLFKLKENGTTPRTELIAGAPRALPRPLRRF
jgi:xanthine/uracil/vitamin C permease (AzgA family)